MLDVDVDYLFFPFDSSVLNTFCVEVHAFSLRVTFAELLLLD